MLRADSILALLVGKHNKGYLLAGSSTLDWLELVTPELALTSCYQKIAADPEVLDQLLVDLCGPIISVCTSPRSPMC